jgi:tripartite-type tricarboxylate transporter receptor subunit TctC
MERSFFLSGGPVQQPYKGAATAITDVLSGQMDMAFEPISIMVGHVREGKVIPRGAIQSDAA